MYHIKVVLKCALCIVIFCTGFAFALTTITLSASSATVYEGQDVVLGGITDADEWVSIRAVDQEGAIVYFSAVKSDGVGAYKDVFTAPEMVGVLIITAGSGNEVATVAVEIKKTEKKNKEDNDKKIIETDNLIFGENVPLGYTKFKGPYLKGYPDGNFRRARVITRAEMATILARVLQLDAPREGAVIFTDLNDSSYWAYDAIKAVASAGYINGYVDGSFKPQQGISRAEVAAVFHQYWEKKGIVISEVEIPLTDIGGHWAEKAIVKAYSAGLISGYPDKTFRPDEFCTREQIAVMVNVFLDRPLKTPATPSFNDLKKTDWSYGDIEAAASDE